MSREVNGKKFGRLYLESFKQAVVKEAELEGSLALICERHSISLHALGNWMKAYGSTSYHANKNKRRSFSEREGIAREIVYGHITIQEAMLKYNAKSRDTVNGWVHDYKQRQQQLTDLLPETLQMPIETAPVSSADLKLAELKIRALEIMLDIASKEFNVDIRKKFGAKP
jgi:transposase-like protein